MDYFAFCKRGDKSYHLKTSIDDFIGKLIDVGVLPLVEILKINDIARAACDQDRYRRYGRSRAISLFREDCQSAISEIDCDGRRH